MFKTRRYFWYIAMMLAIISILATACSHSEPESTSTPTSTTVTTATTTTEPAVAGALTTPAVETTSATSETPFTTPVLTWTPTPELTENTTPTPTSTSTTTSSPLSTPTTTPKTTPTATTKTTTTTPVQTGGGGGGGYTGGGGGGGGTTTPTTTTTPTVQPGTISISAPATVTANSTFTVTVNISQVTNFNAYNFDLTFNNSVIQLNPIDEGGMEAVTNGNISSKTIKVEQWKYDPNGTPGGKITVLGAMSGMSQSSQGVSGSGFLVQLHFIALSTAAGQNSPLVFSHTISLGDVVDYCFDSKGDPLDVSVQNGLISISQ